METCLWQTLNNNFRQFVCTAKKVSIRAGQYNDILDIIIVAVLMILSDVTLRQMSAKLSDVQSNASMCITWSNTLHVLEHIK